MEGRRLIERAFTGPAGLLRARPGQSPALRPVELGVGIFALMSLQRIGEDIVRWNAPEYWALSLGLWLIVAAQLLLVVQCVWPRRLTGVIVTLTAFGMLSIVLGQQNTLAYGYWRVDAWTVTTFIYLLLFRRKGPWLWILVGVSAAGFVALALTKPMDWADQLLAIAYTFATPMVLALASQAVASGIDQYLESQREREAMLGADAAGRRREETLASIRRATHDTVLHSLQLVSSTWARLSVDETRALTAKAFTALSHRPEVSATPFSGPIGDTLRDELADERCRIRWYGAGEQLPQVVTEAVVAAAREAVRNVVKHCAKPEAEIRIYPALGSTAITIKDSGPGFDVDVDAQDTGHSGLQESIRDRMADVGGVAHLASGRSGTTVTLSWPAPMAALEAPFSRRTRGWIAVTPMPLLAASLLSTLLYHDGLPLLAAIAVWGAMAALILWTARRVHARPLDAPTGWALIVVATAATIANMWWIDPVTTNGWSLWMPGVATSLIVLTLPTLRIWHALAMAAFFTVATSAAGLTLLGTTAFATSHFGAFLSIYTNTTLTLLLTVAITAITRYTHHTRQIEESTRQHALGTVERDTIWRDWTAHISRLVGGFLEGIAVGRLDPTDDDVRAEARFLESRMRDELLLWPGITSPAVELDRLRRSGVDCRMFIQSPSPAAVAELALLLRSLPAAASGRLSIADVDGALTATFTDPPLSDDQVASIAEWVSVVDEDFTQALIPEVAA